LFKRIKKKGENMSETITNLTKAFIGESMARNRYTFYAKIAQKEGYEQISNIFLETAEQEREHASNLFKLINELKQKENKKITSINVETEANVVYGDTQENLKAAIDGEHYENSSMYPSFADVAEKEGYQAIANKLRAIAIAEKHHEERYLKLLKEISNDTVFKKTNKVYWVCLKCGYMEEGTTPPKECPSCGHAYSFFQVKCENY